MQVHPNAIDPRVRGAVGFGHQRPLPVAQVKGVDSGLVHLADAVHSKAGGVAELQTAIAPVGTDESGDEIVGRVGQ